MACEPESGALWTVGERARRARQRPRARLPDIGARTAAFYGWPYSYYGQHVDTRVQAAAVRSWSPKRVMPDYALGAHVALAGAGLRAPATLLPAQFRNGAVRRPARLLESQSAQRLQGRVRAVRERPAHRRTPIDVLTGFRRRAKAMRWAGPSASRSTKHGALLVADDVGNAVWRVTPAAAKSASR